MSSQTATQVAGNVNTAPKTSRKGTASVKPGLFTGQEYLESLNDGREVWIYGQRVKDTANHPAFRNSARTIAR